MASNEQTSTPSGSSSAPSANAVRVFLPPTASSSSSSTIQPPLPAEDDLKPTPEELKAAFRSTIAQRHGPDAPLLTRALREREEARLGLHSSRNRTFTTVRIRVRFSDRTMIESTFNEADTIEAVYAFLHASLDEGVRGRGVVLYTAPPRVEYRREDKKVKGKTLRELGLIPSAVVNVKWEEVRMNSNGFPAPLKQELRGKAEPVPPPPSFDQPPPTANAAAQSSSSTTAKDAKPMPKWLKNIVKK
uniref:UBX domain-containing protein n=1 Tax=Kalmanozyma brasiliensis (strain GHG001) TaxID=1365824 RepID=V5EDQ5_KALBG